MSTPTFVAAPDSQPQPAAIAPAWHTAGVLLLLAGMVALGLHARGGDPLNQGHNRLVGYLITMAAEWLIVGFIVTRIRQDDMATVVWLLGLIWLMIIALWIVDMPTRPNECFHCGIGEKLSRTLFSLPQPSGLIDDDGPFLGTWPAAALIGYSIGAALALRRKDPKA